MQGRRNRLLIGIVSALMSAVLVYAVYLLQIHEIKLQQKISIVTPKDFIQAGTLLTSDMIQMQPMYEGAVTPEMTTQASQVIGQETAVPLGKDEPILDWKLDKYHLLPGPDQLTFQIPKDYILSISNGIRAGDQVLLYISDPSGESKKLFQHDIIVASVRSAANMEVDDKESSNLVSKLQGNTEKMYASRRSPNGAIAQVNLNLTEEEWFKIDNTCKQKQAKLVIAFSSASIEKQ